MRWWGILLVTILLIGGAAGIDALLNKPLVTHDGMTIFRIGAHDAR